MGQILKLRKFPTLLRLRDAPQDPTIRVLRTTLNGSPEAHAHEARVDKNGNGLTTIDAGHFHNIGQGEVEEVYGHSHKLIEYRHVRKIGMRATGYRPGSERTAPPNSRRPLAPPGSAGPGGGGLGGGPGGGLGGVGPIGAPGGGIPQGAAPGGPGGAGGEIAFQSLYVPGPILSESAGPLSRFALLADVLQEGDSLIDVGCGSGELYEWLIRELKRPVAYFGVDHDADLLREFRERFPEVGNKTAALGQLTPEIFSESHFTVATCFGLPASFPRAEKTARMQEVVGLMRQLADIVVIECKDKLFIPESEDGPTTWGVAEARKFVGDWKHIIVRPLVENDFAIVAYREGVL